MQFPHELFQRAGLTSSDAAGLFNVSRVTGWRWMRGENSGVSALLRQQVRRKSAALQRAMDDGALPNASISKLPARKRLPAIRRVLRMYNTTK